MGLFDKKTDAEKQRKAEEKEARQQERAEKKEARQDARADKKEARQDARAEKKDARQEARADKKDARQEKRADLKEIRQSDVKGKEKRDQKKDAREDKRNAVDNANKEKKGRIDEAEKTKDERLDDIDQRKREAIAVAEHKVSTTFDAELALAMLAISSVAQFTSPATLINQEFVTSTLSDETDDQIRVRGGRLQNALPITRDNFKADTECFVARTELSDLVVAFRGSEPFNEDGGFRDWVLTDFRANPIPYPPAPNGFPNKRRVHAGIWQAYNLVRNPMLAEVGRQAAPTPVRRIFVTGFSLGGALALLAALDIADAMAVPVELFSFAAPRVGDASLNKLVKERLDKSTLIAFRGDPVVHLPPLGPNFPVTFRHPVSIDPGGIHIPLGNPLPQVNEQYRTADDLFYINDDGEVHDHFPLAQIALRFKDHNFGPYHDAIVPIKKAQEQTATAAATT